ncbi:DsbA family protein [Micromonospora sp. DT81.3]|uniref:DsbA family protein n=1 Tax=Actinomycetes TaxID=1760 RepID=UPI003CEF085D
MSNDETPNAPAARGRRAAVREKAEQVHAQQSRARIIRRVSAGVAIVAAVVAIGVVVTWVFASAASKPLLNPANMQDDGIVVDAFGTIPLTSVPGGPMTDAAPTATPTPQALEASPAPSATTPPPIDIRIYVDYLSPGAGEFQLANAKQLSEWVSEEAAVLTYHPVALLTAKSNGTKYSMRAANATACVATHAPETFFAFNHELLVKQPDVDTDGYTDPELAAKAIAAGAENPKVVRACIEDEDFALWVRDATERALSEDLPGTDGTTLTGSPMILVNGQPYVGKLDDPAEFAQFVLTLSSDAYYSTPSPTPTPSATPSATPSPTTAP